QVKIYARQKQEHSDEGGNHFASVRARRIRRRWSLHINILRRRGRVRRHNRRRFQGDAMTWFRIVQTKHCVARTTVFASICHTIPPGERLVNRSPASSS